MYSYIILLLSLSSVNSAKVQIQIKNHSSEIYLLSFPYGFLQLLYLLHFKHLRKQILQSPIFLFLYGNKARQGIGKF